MKFKLKHNNSEISLESRQNIRVRGGAPIVIDGQPVQVEWNEAQKLAYLRSDDSGLEKIVRFLAIDRLSFPGESEEKIQLHVPLPAGRWGWMKLSSCIDAPGQDQRRSAAKASGTILRSPMTGKILRVDCKNGDLVKEGDIVMIVEAMKMENKILAPVTGIVNKLNATAGQLVSTGETLASIQAKES
jgi:acetyl/propionyl-CoA carboxylase alpha subunit